MAEDIYPLGPNQGLLGDLLNYAINNIYQFGQDVAGTSRKAAAYQPGQPLNPDLMRQVIGMSPAGVTFNKFTPMNPTPGGDVLSKMHKWVQGELQGPGVTAYGPEGEPIRVLKDSLVEDVLRGVARMIGGEKFRPPSPIYSPNLKPMPQHDFSGGIAGLRKFLGTYLPNRSSTASDPGFGGPMPIEDFVGLLQHYNKYGLLKSPWEGGNEVPLNRFIDAEGVNPDIRLYDRLMKFVNQTSGD